MVNAEEAAIRYSPFAFRLWPFALLLYVRLHASFSKRLSPLSVSVNSGQVLQLPS